ncbi:MAG TPA: PDDEXK nuclease domain-containing protein [Candidatus Omnitrophota bacterium]|nr:PDDEXK nuclease domain-containing protein [Candidatus Omnitrophota bacterium]
MNKQPKLKISGDLDGYSQILRDVKLILEKCQSRVFRAVDRVKVEAYWETGQRIAKGELDNKDRADYGEAIVMKLSQDIGIDKSTLYDACRFFKRYPIFHTVCGKLSWSIWRRLIYLENDSEREFYRLKADEENWSVRQFEKALKGNLFKSSGPPHKIPVMTPPVVENAQNIFRDIYDFDFLALPKPFQEYDLETAMTEKTIQVLMELGKHFSLVGRQVRILIDGNWDRIDLVFYHTRLHCYILVELKKGTFKKQYVGQMNAYIEYFRHNQESRGDNPTIGLILCEDIGYEEAVYALGGLEKKVFVAQYRVTLPSEQQIEKKLKELRK